MQKDYKDHLFYNSNSKTFENAKSLRKSTTVAEDVLWNELRNKKFEGLKFRRQHPVGNFIADFYCHELKLVIEVDGGIHNKPENKEYDTGRTFELNRNNLQVIRFSNEEVEKDLSGVLEKLKSVIESL